MKPNEFFKSMGLSAVKKFLANGNIRSAEMVVELKRLVESHELVEKCNGLGSCKKKIEVRDKLKPSAEYFAIHPEKPHLIQMYTRNEAKLVPNYRFDLLEKAIADVEACQ